MLDGIARAQVRGNGGLARGHLADAERLKERQSGGVGQTIEEACAYTDWHTTPRLRHAENDTSCECCSNSVGR
jgi:hypothetical protein